MMTRHDFLRRSACGFGLAALQSLLAGPHHAARAKRVIFLFMQGGPSQMDLFDYKPDKFIEMGYGN